MYYTYLHSPIGLFLLAGNGETLSYTSFSSGHQQRRPQPDWREDAAPFKTAIEQFTAYFEGQPITFDLRLTPKGTSFQLEVWQALQEIPFGQTRSYGDIARWLGKPGASRAVGAANAANHLPIVIPCHRVIGADGGLTGFGGGLDTKRRLLELENASPAQMQQRLL